MEKLKALRGMIAGSIGFVAFGVTAMLLTGPLGWVVAGAAIVCGALAIKGAMDYTDPLEGTRADRLGAESELPASSSYKRMAAHDLVNEPEPVPTIKSTSIPAARKPTFWQSLRSSFSSEPSDDDSAPRRSLS